MNFILPEMTFLRYFIPLVIEGNKRNIKSNFYWYPSNKYNCPRKNMQELINLSNKFNFNLFEISKLQDTQDLTFLVEGVGLDYIKSKNTVSLTCNIDYNVLYPRYKDKVKHIIFPSKYFTEQKISYKGKCAVFDSDNISCLGSPKYDVEIDGCRAKSKFNLNDNDKYCTIILPKLRDAKSINFNVIIKSLKTLGYKIIAKNRAKEGYSFQEADININDEYWFPHSTMDLIHISDLVITFGSLAIKECLMLKTKIINFDVKPFKLLPELYTGNFCVDIKDKNYTEDDLIRYHSLLQNINNFQFDEYIKKYMFPPNSSKRILDHCQSV